jgi:hypothetical protein
VLKTEVIFKCDLIAWSRWLSSSNRAINSLVQSIGKCVSLVCDHVDIETKFIEIGEVLGYSFDELFGEGLNGSIFNNLGHGRHFKWA